jgi:UDP-N-acetyl-D-mannosaminouronate:lipid I N-acetyl-D-mannosaminouronosyltransferase
MYQSEISSIPVDCFQTIDEAVDYIFSHGRGKIAVAINPEKILASIKDDKIKNVLLDADIRYLDGIGAVKVAQAKLKRDINRIPGCELWESLMQAAGKTKRSVFLLGADSTVVSNTKLKLEAQYGVNIIGYSDGFFEDDEAMIDKLLSLQPEILTVAMGSPRQELFMSKCREAGLNSFMMGVGGTYNVYIGTAKRAPQIWCDLGIEWLYRLVNEPSRILRQIKLLKFIWLACLKKL